MAIHQGARGHSLCLLGRCYFKSWLKHSPLEACLAGRKMRPGGLFSTEWRGRVGWEKKGRDLCLTWPGCGLSYLLQKLVRRPLQAVQSRVGAQMSCTRATPRGRAVPWPWPVWVRGLHLSSDRTWHLFRTIVWVPRVGVRELRRENLRR